MKKLNHVMTFESYTMNEEFNPLKKDDWKAAAGSIRRGVGFLTPKEEIQKGKEIVMRNPVKKRAYENMLIKDKEMAEKYLRFWAESVGGYTRDPNSNPVWDPTKRVFVDKSKSFGPTGSIGAGN
jgi:hypothetical protein